MIEIRAGRLCFDDQPLTEELPAALRMRLEEYLSEVLSRSAAVEALDRLDTFPGVLTPDRNFYQLSNNPMELGLPKGWTETWLVEKSEIQTLLDDTAL